MSTNKNIPGENTLLKSFSECLPTNMKPFLKPKIAIHFSHVNTKQTQKICSHTFNVKTILRDKTEVNSDNTIVFN